MPRRGGRAALTPFQIAMVQRPQSNTCRIVFPWLFGRYSKSEFNRMLCQGRVTENDVDRVINELKKSPNYKPTMSCGKVCLMVLGLLGGLFLMISTLLFFLVTLIGSIGGETITDETGESKRVQKESPNPIIYAILPIGLIASCCMMICCNLTVRKQYNKRIEKREIELGKILNDLNEKEFSSKQVSWRIGRLGAWVSLELDFVIAQMNGAAGGGGHKAKY